MSLYNIERPKTLDEVVGQDTAVSQVRGILASGNVPNVSLFVGPRGCGKTTIARIMAKAINCEHPTENGPCLKCRSCNDIETENSIDYIEMDGASNNKVEDVHGIIKGAGFVPTSKYRIYLIDEVHMLSTAAFNALLKLLEEPPEYCRFILCTTEEHKIPATILSRCRRFQFSKMDMATISEHLAKVCDKHTIPFESEALSLIAKAADGCMRDALSIIEPFFDEGGVRAERVAEMLGFSSNDQVFSLLRAIVTGNGTNALGVYKDVRSKGLSAKELVKASIEALTAAVSYLYTQDAEQIAGTAEYKDNVTDLSGIIDVNRVSQIIGELSDLYSVCSYGDDPIIEAKLISLCGSQGMLTEALGKITELEKKIQCLEDSLFSIGEQRDAVSIVSKEPEEEVLEQTPVYQQETVISESETSQESVIDLSDVCPFEGATVVSGSDTLPGDTAGGDVVGTISLSSIVSEAPASNITEFPQNNTSAEGVVVEGTGAVESESGDSVQASSEIDSFKDDLGGFALMDSFFNVM